MHIYINIYEYYIDFLISVFEILKSFKRFGKCLNGKRLRVKGWLLRET